MHKQINILKTFNKRCVKLKRVRRLVIRPCDFPNGPLRTCLYHLERLPNIDSAHQCEEACRLRNSKLLMR